MDLSGLSAVSTGYQRGEMNQATIDEARQRVEQQKLATKQQQDDQAALAILGRALGVAPPDQPPLQGPGQPSQPAPQPPPPSPQGPPQPMPQGPGPAAPPAGVQGAAALQGGPPPPQGPQQQPPRFAAAPTAIPPPGAVPANPAGQRPMPQQQGAPVPRPVPPPSAGGPAAGGAPPQAAAPGPIVPGQTSLQDLTQRIIRANPGIQSRPDLLVRAIDKGQKLLAPDEKVLFDQQKLGLEYSAKMQKLDSDQQIALTKATSAQQIAETRANFAEEKAAQANSYAQQMAVLKAGLTGQTNDKKAEGARRTKAVAVLTKNGDKIDPAASVDDLEQAATVSQAKKNTSGELSDDDAKTLAEAYYPGGDKSVITSLGSGMSGSSSANRTKVMKYVTQNIQQAGGSGTDIAKAQAAFGAAAAAARTGANQGEKIDIGSREIDKFAPMVLSSSAKVDRGKFPTINKIDEAAQQGVGGTAIIALRDNINALKQAYAQVIARGGTSSVDARKRADEVINAAWAKGQIKETISQIQKEAAGARTAAKESVSGVVSDIGGGSTTGLPPDAVKDLKADSSPERQKQFDDVFGAGAAKKALGQ